MISKFNIFRIIKLTDRVAPESVNSDYISVNNLIGVNAEFTMEEWKDVQETGGKYQISNYGRLRTKDSFVKNGHGKRFVAGRVRKITADSSGYLMAAFYLGGKRWTKRIHSLVWEHFGEGKASKKNVVDHKDSNKQNNHISNLQLISQRNNILKSELGLINKSGCVGIRYRANRGKWNARIMIDGVRKYLGSYATKEEARDAYLKAYSELENYTKVA